MTEPRTKLLGLLGVYSEPEPLLAAAEALTRQGCGGLDAFTPFPVPELEDLLGAKADRLPWIVLAGGVVGALAAYLLILYSVEIDYPIDVGGRPLHAWPAFVVIAFESGILGAALAGFIGMLFETGLPTYYHPIFDASRFTFARGDCFYLFVPRQAAFDDAGISSTLSASGAIVVEKLNS